MTNPLISAYVPCFNNASTILKVVESIRRQTIPIQDIVIVDDGSTDGSLQIATEAGITVVCNESNRGRGSANARAMLIVRNELVLCCGATNALPEKFVEIGLPYMEDQHVAAAFGRIVQRAPRSVADRW